MLVLESLVVLYGSFVLVFCRGLFSDEHFLQSDFHLFIQAEELEKDFGVALLLGLEAELRLMGHVQFVAFVEALHWLFVH